MATTLGDLRLLGYSVGLAHGSVQVEQDALDAAKATADPQTVVAQANTVTADTIQALADAGRLPDDAAGRLELATQIGTAALEMLSEHVAETVAFHERALAIAKEGPDVWHLDGPGFAGYVSCNANGSGWDEDSQALLEALADPGSHAERVFQADQPDAMQAAASVAALGYLVERPRLGADVFTVDGKEMTGAQITALADTADPKPAAATELDRVLDALDAAPELSAATHAALRAARSG